MEQVGMIVTRVGLMCGAEIDVPNGALFAWVVAADGHGWNDIRGLCGGLLQDGGKQAFFCRHDILCLKSEVFDGGALWSPCNEPPEGEDVGAGVSPIDAVQQTSAIGGVGCASEVCLS